MAPGARLAVLDVGSSTGLDQVLGESGGESGGGGIHVMNGSSPETGGYMVILCTAVVRTMDLACLQRRGVYNVQCRDRARRVFTDQADIACTNREAP